MPESHGPLSKEEGARIVQVAATWGQTPYAKGKAVKCIGADCSWSTWAIYKEAGLPYTYATSSCIAMNPRFQRVPGPQEGDIACWQGRHVAIYAGSGRIWTAHHENGPGYSEESLSAWLRSTGWKNPIWLRYCK